MCQKTDSIRPLVTKAVQQKLDSGEPFTTVDISHPLIKADPSIRHYMVRKIIVEMWSNGDIQLADFETTIITVYPDGPGMGKPALLYHPMGYDPVDYNKTSQVLIRNDGQSAPSPVPSNGSSRPSFDIKGPAQVLPSLRMPDAKQSTSIPAGSQLPAGTIASKTVYRQKKEGAFNIPAKLVRTAGFKPGDHINFDFRSSTKFKIIRECTHQPHQQRVDKEGRIRLYGTWAQLAGDQAVVCVINNPNEEWIELI